MAPTRKSAHDCLPGPQTVQEYGHTLGNKYCDVITLDCIICGLPARDLRESGIFNLHSRHCDYSRMSGKAFYAFYALGFIFRDRGPLQKV
jgi:hypothetical protein